MPSASKLRHLVSVILHGETRPVYADIKTTEPSGRLKEKRIIVTGGARGLGKAMTRKFASEGAEILITGRDENALKTVAEETGSRYLQLDLLDIRSFPRFIESAVSILGGADILVNNAGISLHEPDFLQVSEDQYDCQFNTNLKGAFFLTQEFVRMTIGEETKKKKILFISSETGITADDRPYGLTKAALNSLVQGLAYRYARKNYRINALAPGVTATGMTGLDAEGDLRYESGMTGRCFIPEEMAEFACFLLSDTADIMNGQILVCNEGKTINARWR